MLGKIVVLVEDGVPLLDAAGVTEVFTVAARYGGPYQVRLASPGGRDVCTTAGVRLRVDLAIEEVDEVIDTLVVTGSVVRCPGREPSVRTEQAAQVRRIARRARRVVSVCTGALLLAASGLLDGRRATTHWSWCDRLASLHPKVVVQPDSIFEWDGPVATSAGVTAGIDLALALVERDMGPEAARRVARSLVVFLQRPGGQSQFSAGGQPQISCDTPLRKVLDAVALSPGEDHSVPAMAARAMLSVRHFTRLFSREMGISPAQYVEQTRVEAARGLLENGDDGVEDIARLCGFGTAETMRRAFIRVLGVPPVAYRGRFRTTGICADPLAGNRSAARAQVVQTY
ncbi:GlxA family transcriptional regulator [Allokutzneria albata]|uniref:GlxA family transcriptional regulator n=1 Tax=Allokutzneria albata TaxID=211114 RepID=UPI000AE9701E|nr:DJ-1/PfpI family protein [Allokutzneria albata]